MQRFLQSHLTWMGLGVHRMRRDPLAVGDQHRERSLAMLARVLHLGNAVAVVGNGCSRPLGYPSWGAFVRLAVRLTKRQLSEASAPRELTRRLDELVGRRRRLPPEAKMSALGYCHRLLDHFERASAYREKLNQEFVKLQVRAAALRDDGNPYHALMRLAIHRFVTTNYDVELERAIAAKRGICPILLGLQEPPPREPVDRLSFTQAPKYRDQLAQFALADTEMNGNMVFHCHGRYDEPDSMIASEEEYQSWYLTEAAGTPFRQTLDLLFGSNPLLFVGYSLGDEDLLHPLRVLGAADPALKHTRPVFALVPLEEHSDVQQEQMYARFGVNVISYEVDGNDDRAHGTGLCNVLQEIQEHAEDIRTQWLEKPVPRCSRVYTSDLEPERVYRYYKSEDPYLIKKMGRSTVLQAELAEVVAILRQQDTRVLLLTGDRGTGKTHHALSLLEDITALIHRDGDGAPWDAVFFWDLHHADDAITALDRLTDFFERHEECPRSESSSESRFKRLSRILRARRGDGRPRYLIILDGCDRLLREVKPGVGRSYSLGFTAFLSAIAESETTTKTVLVSRILPDVFLRHDGPAPLVEGVKRFVLQRFGPANVRWGQEGGEGVSPLSGYEENDVSALLSLIEGSSKGVAMAALYLDILAKRRKARGEEGASASQVESDGRSDGLDETSNANIAELIRELSKVAPNARLGELIRIILQTLDDESAGGASEMLRYVALFGSPVDETTLAQCYRDQCAGARTGPKPEDLIEDLVKRRVLYRIRLAGRDNSDRAYLALPDAIRRHVRPSVAAGGLPLPSFGLCGATSGKEAVRPAAGQEKVFYEIFDCLENRVIALIERLERRPREPGSAEEQAMREQVRRIYSLVRAQMDVRSAPSWTEYRDYVECLFRLVALVNRAAGGRWNHRSRYDLHELEAHDGILYAGDLAWLYHELGSALRAEGSTRDAQWVWEQSYELNRVLEGPGNWRDAGDVSGSTADYRIQSLLNFCALSIDRGRLVEARDYASQAARINALAGQDPEFGARIGGYAGLVAHLQGDLDDANDLYGKAVEELIEVDNPRGMAMFLCHHADLVRARGALEIAEGMLARARAIAEAHDHYDVVARARLSECRLLIVRERHTAARAELRKVLVGAGRKGARHVETVARTALSGLALAQGDAEGARGLAIQALSMANELGLGLRRTAALGALALAMMQLGERDLGRSYLDIAKRLAREQGYWLYTRQLERRLMGSEDGALASAP